MCSLQELKCVGLAECPKLLLIDFFLEDFCFQVQEINVHVLYVVLNFFNVPIIVFFFIYQNNGMKGLAPFLVYTHCVYMHTCKNFKILEKL